MPASRPLNKLQAATLAVTVTSKAKSADGSSTLLLENKSALPAFFISLNLVDSAGADVNPVRWSDNFVTLFPNESLEVTVGQFGGSSKGAAVVVSGKNVARTTVALS